MARIIGIRHRVKKTATGEARPTMVAIKGNDLVELKLDDEDAEIDLVLGQIPTKWRRVEEGEDVSAFLPRRCKTKKDSEDRSKIVITQVPIEFDGLREGDTVAMVLGGSGNYLAYALARQATQIGAEVIRITPAELKKARGGDDSAKAKEEDHILLTKLASSRVDREELFQPMTPGDLDLIRLQMALKARIDAMKARIACEQRLQKRTIGQIFMAEELSPEQSVHDAYLAAKATDLIFKNLEAEEDRRVAELKKALHSLPVWSLFEGVTGCGELIASRIVAAIGDIRRFESKAKLKRFCGVHVNIDGSFVRHRSGVVGNWHPDARQALYLLADQFNRRPDSIWGTRLRTIKAVLRAKHPEAVEVPSAGNENKLVKKYTDGHIHKMGMWRVVTKFVEWLWSNWWQLERARANPPRANTNDAEAA